MVPVIMNHRAYNGSGRLIASCSLISGGSWYPKCHCSNINAGH